MSDLVQDLREHASNLVVSKKILILKGVYDRVIAATSTQRLETLLRSVGVAVTPHVIDAGHEITGQDLEKMTYWLAKRLPR